MYTFSIQKSLCPSPWELAKAAGYLVATRDTVLDTVTDLSDSQWGFTPAADGWSIAEILEHLAIIEERVPLIVGKMAEAPQSEPNRSDSQIDQFVLEKTQQRATRVPSPPQVFPTGRWNTTECLSRFVQGRTQTLELLNSAASLRGNVLPHPVFGLLDGYQWIIALAGHTDRHVQQMLEVKATVGFPITGQVTFR